MKSIINPRLLRTTAKKAYESCCRENSLQQPQSSSSKLQAKFLSISVDDKLRQLQESLSREWSLQEYQIPPPAPNIPTVLQLIAPHCLGACRYVTLQPINARRDAVIQKELLQHKPKICLQWDGEYCFDASLTASQYDKTLYCRLNESMPDYLSSIVLSAYDEEQDDLSYADTLKAS